MNYEANEDFSNEEIYAESPITEKIVLTEIKKE